MLSDIPEMKWIKFDSGWLKMTHFLWKAEQAEGGRRVVCPCAEGMGEVKGLFIHRPLSSSFCFPLLYPQKKPKLHERKRQTWRYSTDPRCSNQQLFPQCSREQKRTCWHTHKHTTKKLIYINRQGFYLGAFFQVYAKTYLFLSTCADLCVRLHSRNERKNLWGLSDVWAIRSHWLYSLTF